MNIKIRQKAKNAFEKDLFKLVNIAIFGKTMENLRKYTNIKLVRIERGRNCLVSEPNYHTRKFLTENLLVIKMRKTKILVKKPVYLSLSILNLLKL